MKPRLTCFGGVREIGGNKLLLEDGDTKVLLDFGTGSSDGADFFGSSIEPRQVNGAGDLFEFGLLPELPGMYSEKALQNTELHYESPTLDGVVLSHFHWDHVGRIGYLDPKIPIHCGETTKLIHEAYATTKDSPLEGHDIRSFRTGSKFKVGSVEFVPIHVDHSIPGAYGFIVHTSEGTIAYTGDFRFHGPAGEMTRDFIQGANEAAPDMLVTEGTRVGQGTPKRDMSEGAVLEAAKSAVKDSRGLVFSTFRGNDIDRINTFQAAAEEAGRRLVVSMKVAVLLDSLGQDMKLHVPRVGQDVDVYLRRKRTGRMDDSDYLRWERKFIEKGTTAAEIKKHQRESFLHLEVWNFPELIDIRPEKGGTYIHSATEAFNEEGEREDVVVRNWIDHLGFKYTQLHASGHAPESGVRELVNGIGAGKVVPVHTEAPETFKEFGRGGSRVEIPQLGAPIVLE